MSRKYETHICFSDDGPWVPVPSLTVRGAWRQLDKIRSRDHAVRIRWFDRDGNVRGTTYLWWGMPHRGPRGLSTTMGPRIGMQVRVFGDAG